jgi:riboflavin synthase
MFTGLVEEVGLVTAAETHAAATQLQIETTNMAGKVNLGDSIAVNGCCLTVSARADNVLTFDLLSETLERTNLKTVGPGSRVNLERAVAAGAPLGGHFVQGHIDCASPIVSLGHKAHDLRIEIELPHGFAHYVAFKGSIAVNGISLTVAEVSERSFVAWIIPHTKAQTNLGDARVGDLVNLEFDLLAKYVERLIHRRSPP